MYPFVCSHACDTGRFNVDECFGETWVREANKAGLAFWGASGDSLWSEDDKLEKKMFYSWWEDNIETIGGMTDKALYYIYQMYQGGSNTKYYFEVYNLLGDPSVKIWHDDPQTSHLIHGYAYYGDTGIPAIGADVTVQNVRSGDELYTSIGYYGYYEVDISDMPNDWINGDIITITVAGNGDYENWIGSESIVIDEDVTEQQVPDIILQDVMVGHTFSLKHGWNLITIPVENDYTAETLGQEIDGCTVICRFNATTQTFNTHVIDIPHNDFPIEDGIGYWFYVTADTTFTVNGPPIDSVSINVYSGWNMIGWTHSYPTDAETLGDSLTYCTVICKFNATTQTFNTHVIDIPHNNFTIERGMAFFVYMTNQTTWNGED